MPTRGCCAGTRREWGASGRGNPDSEAGGLRGDAEQRAMMYS